MSSLASCLTYALELSDKDLAHVLRRFDRRLYAVPIIQMRQAIASLKDRDRLCSSSVSIKETCDVMNVLENDTKTGHGDKRDRVIQTIARGMPAGQRQQYIDELLWALTAQTKKTSRRRKIPSISTPLLTMDDLIKRLPYQHRTSIPLTSIHIGQRKLFISELRFLTQHARDNDVVVYAGAAPGQHIPFLSELFPTCKFVLIDPAKFDLRKGISKVEVYNKGFIEDFLSRVEHESTQMWVINDLFTDQLADILSSLFPQCLFISDIRTAIEVDGEPSTLDVVWNLAQQFNWVTSMKPRMSMLKFRHPFYLENQARIMEATRNEPYSSVFSQAKENGIDFLAGLSTQTLTYLDGEIQLQAWAGQTSAETRLITDGTVIREYGQLAPYEQALFHYNNVTRCFVAHDNSNADLSIGFDMCNDCAIENLAWVNYISSNTKTATEQTEVRRMVSQLNVITRPLLRERHGRLSSDVLDSIALVLLNTNVLKQYSKCDVPREDRRSDPLISLRNFNNAAKRQLIQRVKPRGGAVLDMACGKGGDLQKWIGISQYVGIDISAESVESAQRRYSTLRPPVYDAMFVVGDSFNKDIRNLVDNIEGKFTVVSCMFALHYAFSSEENARQAASNIAISLKKGGRFIAILPDEVVLKQRAKTGKGTFGNDIYSVTFERNTTFERDTTFERSVTNGYGQQYHFFLKGLIDCPEYLVYNLNALMKDEGMTLEYASNLSRFTGYGSLSESEKEVASLYRAVVYVKRSSTL